MTNTGLIVVGNGPAGISAALYALRGGVPVTVIGKDGGALLKTNEIENYYGFPEVISGTELLERGLAQARRLGATILTGEVVHLGYDGNFTLGTSEQEWRTRAVILATGASRQQPKIEGLSRYEGAGVSFCATCDAFFYRGKDVAVLGSGEFAMHEALALLPVVRSVTLLTNEEPVMDSLPAGIRALQTKIARFEGEEILTRAVFEDGESLPIAGLFVAVGVAGSTALARKLGAATEGSRIVVGENMVTSVPGLYAAGDCTGGLLQIAKAVHEGVVAGMQAAKDLRGPG